MSRNDLVAMISQLEDHQISQLQEQAEKFMKINNELKDAVPHACPCCKSTAAHFIKKGFSGRKQRYQCKECGRKFTADAGRITSYSHQTDSKWALFIEDTLDLLSIDKSAEHIGVCHTTAFYMRQKLMAFLEDTSDSILDGMVEADETYTLESQKGKPVLHRKARKHGESATKRGLSSEQMCVCVAVDRDGNLAAQCVNRAKPSSEDIKEALGENIAEGCVLQIDGLTSYNQLIAEKHCTKIVLNSHEDYNKVYHLNTVNGLHNRLKEMLRRYRGVSSKYLNRYLTLFMSREHCSELASIAENVRLELSRVFSVHTIENLMNKGLLTI